MKATVAIAVAILTLTGCATTTSRVDPLEPVNRAMFAINEPIDRDIIKPMVQAYIDNVHPVARRVVSNFFNNIEDFFSGVNGLLQNKPEKAGHDFGRVIVNTGFGFLGLIDFASEANIPRGEEDLGQTFGHWGIPQGPYLFLPLFGPTTARDGTGFLISAYASPIDFIPAWEARTLLFGLGYLDARAEVLEAQGLAQKAALDPYTFVRRSYLQRREYVTYDGKPPPRKDEDE
ncbi:MAG TPA: VacJ family lipoprotein [Casimicrobiaceae bacterium]|nr:VacJ family lipoprotein [Casimicrobiaceae bacterium]